MISRFSDYIVFLIFRFFFGFLSLLPDFLKIFFIKNILNLFIFIKPRFKKISSINLKQAFPNLTEEERYKIFLKHKKDITQHLVDIINLKKFTKEWADKNLSSVNLDLIKKYNAEKKGILFVSGHLSSFELMAHFIFLIHHRMNYVVRALDNQYIDKWWNKRRCSQGNEIIYRKNAYRNLLRKLKNGENVGILFDQNVIRSNATFVEWFDKKASTTKAPALALLHTKTPCLLINLKRLPKGKFEIEFQECHYSDIVEDKTLSKDEKIRLITERLVHIFSSFIKEEPEKWFWMHRRWKTSSSVDIPEDFYK